VEGDSTNNAPNENDINLRMSPLSQDSLNDHGGSSKRKSPVATMAEASLLAQKAVMQKKPRMQLKWLQELKVNRREVWISKAKVSRLERITMAKVLQKIKEKLCPKEDSTDKYTAWKQKLDEVQAALGEDIFHMKVKKLKDEFMKTNAM